LEEHIIDTVAAKHFGQWSKLAFLFLCYS